MIAFGTFLTLAFSETSTLFRPAAGVPGVPICNGPSRVSLFCILGEQHLELGRWISVALLLFVMSGWRPRLTGLLHWWVSFSLPAAAVVVDGGDQVASVLTLLLIPVTLTDKRRWHWQSTEVVPEVSSGQMLANLLAASALWVIRLQMAGIYFHAFVAKFSVPEWVNGTALYYWLEDPNFGASPWLRPFLDPLLIHAASVCFLTWSVLILEVFLTMGLVISRRHWSALLWSGFALHSGIALVHGLVSFGFAMFGGLILYLRPTNREYRLPVIPFGFRGLLRVPPLARDGSSFGRLSPRCAR
jgi:antimicrobial peptide system SdpB family protein